MTLDPVRVSLGTLLDTRAVEHPEATFLSFEDGATLSFGEAAEVAARVRGLLDTRDAEPGGRVALMMKNSLFYPVGWLGITSGGRVAVPINSRLGPDDTSYIVEHSRAATIICDDTTAPVVKEALGRSERTIDVIELGTGEPVPSVVAEAEPAEAAPSGPRTLANVQYTSGTTGFPKGCLLTHGYWQWMGKGAGAFLRLEREVRLLTAQPFSYIDPLWHVVAALQTGAHLVILEGFHASTFMRRVAEWEIDVFYCLGVMPTLMLKQPEGPHDHEHRLRFVACSGMPPDLHRAIEDRWGVPWYEAFGMTETGWNVSVAPEDHDRALGTGCIGRAVEHCEVSVVDEEGHDVAPGEVGEMRLRGLGLMEGYLDDPEATARFFRNGWANTGDLVAMDDDGLIYFRGRRKEFVRRGGENVSQAEVEFALRGHEDVLDCAVAPVPDDALGEEGKAYVVVLEGRARDPETLRAFLASKLASFKVPRYYEFRDDLPRTPSERIAKGQLEAARASWRLDTYDARTGSWLE